MEQQEKKRQPLFAYSLLITVIVLLVFGLCGAAFLWTYLADYEQSNPKTVMRELAQLLEKEDFSAAMKLSGVDSSVFYDEAQYPAYMKQQLGELSGLTVQELGSASKEERRYALLGSGEGRQVAYTLTPTQEEGKYYTIKQDDIPTSSYTVTIPEGATLCVNGLPLDGTAQTWRRTLIPSYSVLNEPERGPYLLDCRLNGFTIEPEFTLADQAVSVVKEGQTVQLLPVLAEEKRVEYEALAEKVARVYAAFTSQDAKRSEVQQYLDPDTEFYKRMLAFDNFWFIEHDTAEFRTPRFENTVEYGDGFFSTEIYFDYFVKKGRIEKTYESHYRMSFIQKGEKLLVANIEIL